MFKEAMLRFVDFEKFSLIFRSSSFPIHLIFSILYHPCSFKVYYHHFGDYFQVYFYLKIICLRGQN